MRGPRRQQRLWEIKGWRLGIIGFLFLMLWFIFANLPVTFKDWVDVFRPAALHLVNPYEQSGLVFNPPWIFPLLYPFAWLPHPAGAGLMLLVSMALIALYVESPQKMVLMILSAPVIVLITLGQLDCFLLLGLILPQDLGIPLLLAKPQGVFLTILPRFNRWSILWLGGVVCLSILIWGFWWQHILDHQPNQSVNLSLFPYSLPFGLLLAYWGLKNRHDALLCLASLCFAPYFMITSLVPALAGFMRETEDWRWQVTLVLGSWGYYLGWRIWG